MASEYPQNEMLRWKNERQIDRAKSQQKKKE